MTVLSILIHILKFWVDLLASGCLHRHAELSASLKTVLIRGNARAHARRNCSLLRVAGTADHININAICVMEIGAIINPFAPLHLQFYQSTIAVSLPGSRHSLCHLIGRIVLAMPLWDNMICNFEDDIKRRCILFKAQAHSSNTASEELCFNWALPGICIIFSQELMLTIIPHGLLLDTARNSY